MTPDSLAIVRIPHAGQVRPAAFVFQDADGLAWVEPHYLGPEPASRPAWHRIDGHVTPHLGGAAVFAGDDVVALVMPLGTEGADDPDGSCSAALVDFTDALAEAGRTVDEERKAVAMLLAESVG